MVKKLYRSKDDAKISGVCGGIGKYLNIDSTIIRIIWIVIVFASGILPGVVAYIVGAAIIPQEPDGDPWSNGDAGGNI
jgi:phage shock protein PspC (stress-responsive transcriptional regulator)